jgi:hypothetical protein
MRYQPEFIHGLSYGCALFSIPTRVYSSFIFRLSSIFDTNRSLFIVYLPVEFYSRYQPEFIHGLSYGCALFSIPTGVYSWFIFRLSSILDTNRSLFMVYLPVVLYFRYQPEFIHGLSSGCALFSIPTGVYSRFIFRLSFIFDTNRNLFTVYLPVVLYFRYQLESIHGLSYGCALFSIPTRVYSSFIFRLSSIFDTNRCLFMIYLTVELYFRYQPEFIHGLSYG